VALSDEDIREILRLIDESAVDELRIETPEFKLHVRRGGAPAAEDIAWAAPAPPPVVAAREEPNGSDDAVTIDAPMLGTFYAAQEPGAEPFVKVGARVEPDTVVCLIEVMKMMNSIQAGLSGTVVEVCAENAGLVEYGAPLFRVEPAS
jgi:acetyl-CoA carboxylase biotin carboxyl carrier protein